MSRLLHFIFGAVICIFGWAFMAAAYLALQHGVPDPMPVWLWNLCFTSMLLAGLIAMVYGTFKACDELFYQPWNSRRITGRRMAPPKSDRVFTVKAGTLIR